MIPLRMAMIATRLTMSPMMACRKGSTIFLFENGSAVTGQTFRVLYSRRSMRLSPGTLATSAFILAVVSFPPALRSAEIPDVPKLLAGIENRYNHIQTLEVAFTETWTLNGRKRIGSGTLVLRKPGKMRWEYAVPPGRLFISDGEFIYSYSQEEHRAEKIKMKAVED